MQEKGANQQLLKRSNYKLIKKCIYQGSPISRVEVAHELGLTTASITGMVNQMLAKGLLRETESHPEKGSAGAGRPRVMLEFEPNAYAICGVDVGPYSIHYLLTDLQGTVLYSLPTDNTLDEYDKTFALLRNQLPRFLEQTGIPREKLLGIGVTLPGLIDGSAGKIYTTFQKGWTEHDLARELGEALGHTVVVENNVRGRAICADLFDRSVTAEPFAYFFVSYGVACQMMLDGRILYGQSAAAGEIGHTVVQRGGPVCPTCGNRGCLEALAGERAVLGRCRRIMASGVPTALNTLCPDPEKLTMEQVLRAESTGDSEVNLVMEDVLDYLGIALANTVNLVSPRKVLLDGRLFHEKRNQELLLQAVERNMFRVHVGKTRFSFLPYDPERGAKGAAAVVIRELLLNSDL